MSDSMPAHNAAVSWPAVLLLLVLLAVRWVASINMLLISRRCPNVTLLYRRKCCYFLLYCYILLLGFGVNTLS